ncbi:hypothetical protein [Peteryoungia algae]|jgi:hypothetical protein|uniref:Uncharacterized protein n=1 Tax=Peteryoungia algae TaxID=2919917 RepID=A0ABT0D3N8_9HYPH|nr:hypothetical protein [Rhizobium sp. SSM4.3]MCJ8240024.1 hypothetical protein [Rhizobium sp. SSM4.3]
MTHVQNVDGQGQLLIGELLSPITYHVAVERLGPHYRATVEMQAPRDWLIRQGFKSRATLVLSSGDRIELEHDGPVDVSDSLRVVLQGKAVDYGDREALVTAFPEADDSLS